MRIDNRLAAAVLALTLAANSGSACAAGAPGPVVLGVLTDMSGFVRDATGPGSVVAAQLAAEDFAATNPGVPVKVIAADHQNKPDMRPCKIVEGWHGRDRVRAHGTRMGGWRSWCGG